MAWCCLDEDAKAQFRVNRAIERKIEQWKRDRNSEIKLLLLGTVGAGKSTFIRQTRIIYGQGYSDTDRGEFCPLVYCNIFHGMQDLIKAMADLNIAYADPGNKKYESMVMFVDCTEAIRITAEQKVAVQNLWKDSGVQRCFERRGIFQTSDSSKYYFDSMERICETGYIPTIDDVLHVRVPTIGIVEYIFQMRKEVIRLIEMGGARSERRKWIHCCDDVKAIIFFCAINEYNDVFCEDPNQNKLSESVAVFENIISIPFFQESSVILCLNKTDLFLEKIMKSHLADYFPTYQGPRSDPEAAKQFILQLFLSANPDPNNKRIFSHFMQATNTENVKRVFQRIREGVLQTDLKDYKLM